MESIVSTPPALITRMSSKMVEMTGGNINGELDGENNMKIWRQSFETDFIEERVLECATTTKYTFFFFL